MVIRVDIDRTLCDYKVVNGRKTAVPNYAVIGKINALHKDGHEIIVWSSRNVISRSDQTEFSKKQLREWGVKYDSLDLTKPLFDLFIDDHAVNVTHWLEGIEVPGLEEEI